MICKVMACVMTELEVPLKSQRVIGGIGFVWSLCLVAKQVLMNSELSWSQPEPERDGWQYYWS